MDITMSSLPIDKRHHNTGAGNKVVAVPLELIFEDKGIWATMPQYCSWAWHSVSIDIITYERLGLFTLFAVFKEILYDITSTVETW